MPHQRSASHSSNGRDTGLFGKATVSERRAPLSQLMQWTAFAGSAVSLALCWWWAIENLDALLDQIESWAGSETLTYLD
jgi:hypothetical protein